MSVALWYFFGLLTTLEIIIVFFVLYIPYLCWYKFVKKKREPSIGSQVQTQPKWNESIEEDKRKDIRLRLDYLKTSYDLIKKNDSYLITSENKRFLRQYDTFLKWMNKLGKNKKLFSSDFKDYLNDSLNDGKELKNQFEEFCRRLIEQNIKQNSKERIVYLENYYKQIKKADTYLIYPEKTRIINKFKAVSQGMSILKEKQDLFSEDLKDYLDKTFGNINKIQKSVENYNKEFVEERKIKYDYLLKTSDYSLDDYQKTAVITDDKYNLVVAGAGSGKTEVLTNRIAYLIERKPDTISPERILALAFQREAKSEMKKRLVDRWGHEVKVKTFHGFGWELWANHYNSEPEVLGGNNHNFEREKLFNKLYENELTKSNFQNLVINYMGYIGSEEKILEETDFKTKEEFYHYQKNLKIKTLNGYEVRSPAERDIMNFFLTHELNGEKIDIKNETSPDEMDYQDEGDISKHVHPDFFFPAYDIFLEHWAVDENDISKYDGYEIGMNKKKEWFEGQDKYILIETRAFEYKDNSDFFSKLEERFLDAVKKRCPDKKFEFTPIGYHDLVIKVYKDCKEYVKKIPLNISNFIKIAKVNDFSPNDIKKRLDDESLLPIQKAFGRIAVIIYEKYKNELANREEIDYEDMINDAVKILKENKEFYRDTYDHILIDEYQDISEQRYSLINELLKKNPSCKLFCVGDDWQSIMSFSGSNLDYFINFNEFFPNMAMTELPKNYRSNKSVVETGNEIIKHNSKKIAKETITDNKEEGKIQIYISNHDKDDFWRYYEEIAQNCLDDIQVLLNSENNNHKPNDIKILTRNLKSKLKEIVLKRAKERNIKLYCPRDTKEIYPDKIPLMTVHESKGLEAKTVFILDVCKGTFGFPCELEDSIIFNVAKKQIIDDKEAEERRLFYVAITRAKKDATIYTQKSQESKFLSEINKHVTRTNINEKIIPPTTIKKDDNKNNKISDLKNNELKQKYSIYKRVDRYSRTCNHCTQIIPKELVVCPKCGGRLLPIIE